MIVFVLGYLYMFKFLKSYIFTINDCLNVRVRIDILRIKLCFSQNRIERDDFFLVRIYYFYFKNDSGSVKPLTNILPNT